MDKYKKTIIIIAAVIAGIIIGKFVHFSGEGVNIGSVDCNSTTCFTTLGVTTSFTNDGTESIGGTLSVTGATTLTSSTFSVGGQNYYSPKQSFTSATTTPCSILSPSATSTLESYVYKITTGTSTAAVIDVGTSTTAYATSSLNFIHQRSVASGAQDYAFYNATTSATGGASVNGVIAPSTYVNLKTGAGLGGYTFTGTCQAVFYY